MLAFDDLFKSYYYLSKKEALQWKASFLERFFIIVLLERIIKTKCPVCL